MARPSPPNTRMPSQPYHPAVEESSPEDFNHRPRVNGQGHHAVGDAYVPARVYMRFCRCCRCLDTCGARPAKVIKIVPNTDARQLPAMIFPNDVTGTSDESDADHQHEECSAAAAAGADLLLPLIPNTGSWPPMAAGNMLTSPIAPAMEPHRAHHPRMDDSCDEPSR